MQDGREDEMMKEVWGWNYCARGSEGGGQREGVEPR